MPVRRFKDMQDARRELWVDARDPALPGRIRRLWDLSRRLAPPCGPRGLKKFATIEAANAERADRERLRRGRSGMGTGATEPLRSAARGRRGEARVEAAVERPTMKRPVLVVFRQF